MANGLAFDGPLAYNFQIGHLGLLFFEEAEKRSLLTRAEHRDIAITIWDSAKRLPKISMDSARMGQVITNLLDNAVKYSFRKGKINVRGSYTNNSVRFLVENQGLGIPEEYLEAIFEPFQRKSGRRRILVSFLELV